MNAYIRFHMYIHANAEPISQKEPSTVKVKVRADPSANIPLYVHRKTVTEDVYTYGSRAKRNGHVFWPLRAIATTRERYTKLSRMV